jgi:hypothetical protein
MILHELKTWPESFQPILQNKKNFEIRVNDRNYQVGDKLLLLEWDPQTQQYTGRRCYRQISYILHKSSFIRLGKKVILSIE